MPLIPHAELEAYDCDSNVAAFWHEPGLRFSLIQVNARGRRQYIIVSSESFRFADGIYPLA